MEDRSQITGRPAEDGTFAERLGAIERRLAEIERRLDLPNAAPTAAARGALGEVTPPADRPRPVPPPLPVLEPVVIHPLQPASSPMPLAYQADFTERDQPADTLEHVIGLKWAGWIGAVVLVIGAGLGFKFAYDQGWLGQLGPGPKVGLLALCGIALLAAGEFVYRRINRMSAAGLYGAGIAVLFVASYAGYAWYGLFEQSTAMALMAASAITGVLVAARADLVSIAVLAIIGGSLAPALIGGKVESLAPFLTYLLLMQMLAVALCWWQARPKWWVLRGLSLAATTLWLLVIIPSVPLMAAGNWMIAFTFACLFAAIYQLEVVLTTLRAARQSARDPIPTAVPVAGVIFSLLTTAALTGELLLLAHEMYADTVQGIWVLCLSGAAVVAGLVLPVRTRPVVRDLRRGYFVQAILLLVLSVPVALDGPAVVLGWMALALSLAIAGSMVQLRWAAAGSALVWALAVAAWAFWSQSVESRTEIASFIGISVQQRLALAAALAGTVHAIGFFLVRLAGAQVELDEYSDLARVLHCAGAVTWCVAAILCLDATVASAAIGLYGLMILPAGLLRQMAFLRPLGAAVLLAASWKLATFDSLVERFPYYGGPAELPILGGTAVLALLGALLTLAVGLYRPFLRMTDGADRLRILLLASFPLLLLVIGTTEIDRYALWQSSGPAWIVRQVGWSIFWSVLAVLWLVAGFVWHLPPLRFAALALLAAALVKVTLVDLSGAGTGWRILSFLGLGALLLGTSVLYGKFGRPRPGQAS